MGEKPFDELYGLRQKHNWQMWLRSDGDSEMDEFDDRSDQGRPLLVCDSRDQARALQEFAQGHWAGDWATLEIVRLL